MKKMKKKIFMIFPLLAIFIATMGYSYTNKNEKTDNYTNHPAVKKNESKAPCRACEICPPCESCKPKCEPCQPKTCEPCRACEICPPCEPCKPCCTEVPKTGEPCNCAYNAPARIDPACGWKTWLDVSFIYWQPKEKGLELGKHEINVNPSTPPSSFEGHETNDLIDFDYDYKPGFKIGAGWSTCRDDWTLNLEYTRLTSQMNKKNDITNEFILNNNLLNSYNQIVTFWADIVAGQKSGSSGFATVTLTNNDNFIKAKWELSYNIFDLDLGRPYYLGRKLIFKPIFGLRAGWIDQKYHQDFTFNKLINVFVRNHQDTWLIGPRAGLCSDWLIACHFKIFANIAGSLCYQKCKTHLSQVVPIQPNFLFERTSKADIESSFLTPILELGLGIGYGRYFWNNEWHFDLCIGYDFNYLWQQNRMRHDFDSIRLTSDSDAGNLMLQGLTVTGRIDF
jgi:hypothetical protein